MTNEEQILQMLTHMQNSIDNLDKRVENEVEKLNTKIEKLNTKIEDEVGKLNTKIEDEVGKINIQIENDVTTRLNSLFDGYMLTHEKQYELERQLAALQRRVEALETKVS